MADEPTTQEPNSIVDGLHHHVKSTGALHGSARGQRNIDGRIRAMERLAPLQGKHLLDVGCATGEYTCELAPRFAHVTAIDVEQNRLDRFATNGIPANTSVEAQSVYDLDADDHTYDRVTLIEVLEHLGDPGRGMREIGRVLTQDGYLLLTTPNRWWPFEQHGIRLAGKRFPGYTIPGVTWIKPLHRRVSRSAAFTARDLHRLAKGAGLEVTGITYMMPPLDSLEAGSPIHRRLDAAESSLLAPLGQTIVACMRRASPAA